MYKFIGYECRSLFRTASSAGFELVMLPAREAFSEPFASAARVETIVGGGVDVHWNAQAHIKVFVKVFIAKYIGDNIDRDELFLEITALFKELGITESTTFEAQLIPFERALQIENRVDERGIADCV